MQLIFENGYTMSYNNFIRILLRYFNLKSLIKLSDNLEFEQNMVL
jgi:hypothetical protein